MENHHDSFKTGSATDEDQDHSMKLPTSDPDISNIKKKSKVSNLDSNDSIRFDYPKQKRYASQDNINSTKYDQIKYVKKKNKEFDDRYMKLKSRIQILQKEDAIYKRKLLNLQKRKLYDQMIQKDKMRLKDELQRTKRQNDKELQKKREKIKNMNMRQKIIQQEKKIQNINNKKMKYNQALNDKFIRKYIIEQINDQQSNKNNYIHAKVKQQLNESQTIRVKRNRIKQNLFQKRTDDSLLLLLKKEKKMKTMCDKLKQVEKKCLEELNKTKSMSIIFMEESKQKSLPDKDKNKSVDNFQSAKKKSSTRKIKIKKTNSKNYSTQKINNENENTMNIGKCPVDNFDEKLRKNKEILRDEEISKIFSFNSEFDNSIIKISNKNAIEGEEDIFEKISANHNIM